MRTRFDQLAKELSAATLGRGAKKALIVSVEPQQYDLWFDPDPSEAAMLSERGMLGRMGKEPFGLEAFHQAPSVADARECVRKQLNFHRQREIEAKGEVGLAKLWLVCAGRPDRLLSAHRMRQAEGWPPGVYAEEGMLNLWVVVVSELPKTRETLALRLMGRGAVLREASAELAGLPLETWERQRLLPILVRWRFEIPAEAAQRDSDEENFMATAHELFETFEQQAVQRGLQQGVAQGVVLVLGHLFGRRLGRALTDNEMGVVRSRLETLGEDRLDDLALTLDGPALAAWLADPTAR